jgi:hypothetical protein
MNQVFVFRMYVLQSSGVLSRPPLFRCCETEVERAVDGDQTVASLN